MQHLFIKLTKINSVLFGNMKLDNRIQISEKHNFQAANS
jgi:hypothetical protein